MSTATIASSPPHLDSQAAIAALLHTRFDVKRPTAAPLPASAAAVSPEAISTSRIGTTSPDLPASLSSAPSAAGPIASAPSPDLSHGNAAVAPVTGAATVAGRVAPQRRSTIGASPISNDGTSAIPRNPALGPMIVDRVERPRLAEIPPASIPAALADRTWRVSAPVDQVAADAAVAGGEAVVAPATATPATATLPTATLHPMLAQPELAQPELAQPKNAERHIANAEAAAVELDEPLFKVTMASNSFRAKDLEVWHDRIEWGGMCVRFDEIDHFSYEVYRHRTAVLPAHTGYLLVLWSNGSAHSIELVSSTFSRKSTKLDTEMMFEALVSMLHARVGERLMDAAMRKLRLGETVSIGGVRMRWSGITFNRHFRERSLGWDDLAGAEFSAGDVVLHRFHKDETKPVVHIPMAQPDAVLLPDLVHIAAAHFNGKRLRRRQIEKMAADEGRRKAALRPAV